MTAIAHGRPYPLGATLTEHGCNFALYSEHAEGVELCLFDARGRETRVALQERTAFVWHGFVAGIKAGQRYGYRVQGPWAPERGLRFNADKLLVDPYALALDGKVDYRAPVFGHSRDGQRDRRDDAHGVPHGVVVDTRFDWEGDKPPLVPWNDTVIYEAHLKGLSKLHPALRPEDRGTYGALASEPVLTHLRRLGVTSIELLPIHECADEAQLARRGLTNYWGYSTLGYFAPDQRFARVPGEQVREFKEMVKRLHAAGFEVILDVVYNHTAEGDRLGPMLSLRGIDNKTYYRLKADDLSRYEDVTGCGNTLNFHHPQVLKLVTDSLRYWVTEMHVDGFRFDLASALGREHDGALGAWEQTPQSVPGSFRMSTFFDIIHQDPVLSRVKLIAEPWDLGHGGYQVGNFPVLWTEWNGRYRDNVRRFWRGDKGQLADLGYRLTGSSDLYQDDGRHPGASINFVTAHDGFTMADLVAYARKHNEDNGEKNRDGTDESFSENNGAEGPTEDFEVLEARDAHVRALMATLILSQGVPMLLAGDELGNSQRGNNNAYCQDNAISWLDWEHDDDDELLGFTRALLQLRKDHPVFRRRTFFRGVRFGAASLKDISWVRQDGAEMTSEDWSDPERRTVGLLLSGDGLGERDEQGQWTLDDTFLLILHAGSAPLAFLLPKGNDRPWEVIVDTRKSRVPAGGAHAPNSPMELGARTMVVLRQPRTR